MTNGDVFPYFYWKIGYSTTSVFEINTNTNYTRKISKEIINTFKSNENLKIIIGYHLSNGATIVPGTIKPMLWKMILHQQLMIGFNFLAFPLVQKLCYHLNFIR